jgi:hypothetical protein
MTPDFKRQTTDMAEQIIQELEFSKHTDSIRLKHDHIKRADAQLKELYCMVWNAELKGALK